VLGKQQEKDTNESVDSCINEAVNGTIKGAMRKVDFLWVQHCLHILCLVFRKHSEGGLWNWGVGVEIRYN